MSPPLATSSLVGPNDSAKFLSAVIPVNAFVIASLPVVIAAPGAISTASSAYTAVNAATSFEPAAFVHAASAERIAASSTGRVSTAAGPVGFVTGVELHAANPN